VKVFLSFSEERRRTVCEQSQDKLGLPPAAIEKDFWVCWTLKKLFDLPEWGSKLTSPPDIFGIYIYLPAI
jgi:hypothetical protein